MADVYPPHPPRPERFEGPEPSWAHLWIRGWEWPLPEFPAFRFINEARVAPHYRLKAHRHDVFEISYILSGTCEYSAGRRTHLLRAGDLHVTRPGEVHEGRTVPEDPHHNFALGFDPAALPAAAAIGSAAGDTAAALGEAGVLVEATRGAPACAIPGARGIETVLWRILDELDDPEPRGGRALRVMMVQCLLTEVLLHVARCFAAVPDGAEELPAARRREVAEVAAWLRSRLRDPPGLAEMAQRAGLSPGHFAAVFKRELGATPLDYLTGLRVDEAARRLRALRPPSVARVAAELGFASPQYFAVVFRKRKGVTPGEWRRGA